MNLCKFRCRPKDVETWSHQFNSITDFVVILNGNIKYGLCTDHCHKFSLVGERQLLFRFPVFMRIFRVVCLQMKIADLPKIDNKSPIWTKWAHKCFRWKTSLYSYNPRADRFSLKYFFSNFYIVEQENFLKNDNCTSDNENGVDIENNDDYPLMSDLDGADHDPNDMSRPRKIRR